MSSRFSAASKMMSSDWESDGVDLSRPAEIGIRWVSPFLHGPVDLESGYSYAWARDRVSGVDLKSDISRIHAGVRYGLPGRWVLVHIVGGLQWMEAALEADLNRQGEVLRDSTVGLYAGTGASVPVTPSFRLGADFRYTWSSLELGGEDVEGGGVHLAGLVGVAW